MKRANRAERIWSFVRKNRRAVTLWGLLFIGIAIGVAVGCHNRFLPPDIPPVGSGFFGIVQSWASAVLLAVVLLGVHFVCGLSACGAPIILFTDAFWGMGIGMTMALYYAAGWSQMAYAALLWLPVRLLMSLFILMGCTEALRLSLRLGQQLVSSRAVGMTGEFKMYCLRFAVLMGSVLLVGVLDVILRCLSAGLFK